MEKKPFCRSGKFYWLIFIGSTITFFALGVMITLVLERRHENLLMPMVLEELDKNEADSSLWKKNFPREYESFMMTKSEGVSTKHGGSVPFSHLERTPALKVLFAGYPFAVDYNDDRGHAWALDDVKSTGRMDPARGGKPMPGTCMNCKTSQLPNIHNTMGAKTFYKTPFNEIAKQVEHGIGCANCHDGATLELRITNLACREALQANGTDPDKLSHQELRTMVCAQCHLEYHFGKGAYLIVPWKYGTTPEAMEKYYDEIDFTDWTHKLSKTPMIKMQHPDYEIFKTGIHAYNGLSCADCHMPYSTQGGMKFTSHHVQSPLLNIANVCLNCHVSSEEKLRKRVESIQDTTFALLTRSYDVAADAHKKIESAIASGVSKQKIAAAQKLLRRAQLHLDYIAASNSMGFHSPQECARVLFNSLDYAHQAILALRK